MNFEKRIRGLPDNYFGMAIFGKILIIFSLGSIYSRPLIKMGFGPFGAGYLILAIAVIILVNTLNTSFLSWKKNNTLTLKHYFQAYSGLGLLVLFFGMQSTQIPFKEYLLILGVLATLPAGYIFLKNG